MVEDAEAFTTSTINPQLNVQVMTAERFLYYILMMILVLYTRAKFQKRKT